MKIDLHTHIIPEHLPDWSQKFGHGDFVSLQHHAPCRARMMKGDRVFREIEENCWNAARRIEDCLRDGVDVQALSTIPVLFSYWAKPEHALDIARLLNDHIAEVVRAAPRRFVGLGTLPMQSPELAIRELERCVNELGLSGIEIGTHVNQWNLDDAEVVAVLRRAAELNAAVFVHPWDMMGSERMTRYMLPWIVGMPAETSLAICSMIFGGVFDALPTLRVAFAHGGGAFPGTMPRIEHTYHARPDLCAKHSTNPRSYLGRFYVDSLVHDADGLRGLLALFSEKRVILGSDYPFPLGESPPGRVIDAMADLSPQTRERVLAENCLEFLQLDRQRFA